MTISSIHICTKSPDPAKLLLYKKMLGKTQTALHAQSPYTRGSSVVQYDHDHITLNLTQCDSDYHQNLTGSSLAHLPPFQQIL